MKNGNKSDLSDLSTSEKIIIRDTSSSFSDPLSLYRQLSTLVDKSDLSDKCPQPIATPGPDLPDREPVFTPEQERALADFAASRPRDERLAMHRRSLYLRADRGWAWAACDLQSYHEAWRAAGKPSGPYPLAADGLAQSAAKDGEP